MDLHAAGKPITISFTPHLVPMNRGILVTAYASLKKDVTYEGSKGQSMINIMQNENVCPCTGARMYARRPNG